MNYIKRALKLRLIIEKAVVSLDDETALEAVDLYPKWVEGKAYEADARVRHGDKLYKVISAHTSQADWSPDIAESLFTVINETNGGTLDDPIPYDGNMALEYGKYYEQNGVVYLCNRDTVNPIYHALSELVGLYVEKV